MADEFDPYSAWLGIRDASRPLSHYQLLGLNEFEENALAISIAAESAIARLKRTDPGDRRGRWQQTMDEVTLAKLCLTNRTRKIQYDSTLRERRGSESAAWPPSSADPLTPTPATTVQTESSPTPAASNADHVPPTMPPPPASVPLAQAAPPAYAMPQPIAFPQPTYVAIPAAQPMAAPVGMPIGYSSPYGSPMPGYAPAAMPVPRGVPVEPVAVPGPDRLDSAPAASPTPFDEFSGSEPIPPSDVPNVTESIAPLSTPSFELDMAPARIPARRSSGVTAPNPKVLGTAAAVALVLLVGFVVFKSLSRPPVQLAVATEAASASDDSASGVAPLDQSPVVPEVSVHPTIKEPTPSPAVEPPQPTAPVQSPKMSRQPQKVAMTQLELPDTEPATQPEPQPSPEPPQPPAQTPEQKAAFEKAVQNARAAMGARQLPLAKQELQTAKSNVGSVEQDTQLARHEELYGYVEGFWKAVLESMKGLQATDTLPIDNTEIAIVEVDGEKLTIRAAGRNLSYTLQTMPSGLALALAKRWFNASEPANNIYLGAFHAVDPQGNLNEARRCWEAATRGGASAESLMPLLEERTQALVAEQQPVPKRAILARARAALRRSMPDAYRAARSLDRKRSLARELLDAAVQNENPIERYTLYDEALHLAADAGSVVDMNTALDGLIAGYKVDPWELRADAFDDAADHANNPVVAKAMARDMVEIVDRALAESEPAVALKLCNALLDAARKGKDVELVRQANERKAKLTGNGQ